MSLRDVCRTFGSAKPAMPRLPAVPGTVKSARRMDAHFVSAELEPPANDDHDVIALRITAALASGASISRKDLRHAPWCIFTGRSAVGNDPIRLEQLLREFTHRGQARLLRTLAAAYFHFFDPGNAAIRTVAAFLAEHIDHLGAPWTLAHREAQVFEPAIVAETIAKSALAKGSTPDLVIQDLGFPNPDLFGGVRKQAHFSGLDLIAISTDFEALEHLRIVGDWSVADGRLRYDEGRARVANALMLPFGDSTPDELIRKKYLSYLLPLMGDPRTSRGKWIGCEKAERAVRRWLMEVTLRQFFDVVDKVAAPELWVYRRAFWNALHERKYISEAWVVFERHGAAEARRAFGSEISFAVFDGGGIQPGHSALLLRIGELVVAEWSHNGKCSIWDESAGERAPRLFERTYEAATLRKDVALGHSRRRNVPEMGVFIHHGSQTYAWQGHIAQYLKRAKGIYLNPSDYEIRP